MGIELASQFDVQTALPLDSRLKVADTTARDAIDALVRYEGMIVYVVADETNYQLIGGITNGDWQELSGGGGGGGGGGFQAWYSGVNAPQESIEYNEKIFLFSNTVEELFQTLMVPEGYEAGSPITVDIAAYSPSSSNNFLIRAQATLIRKNTDALSSTTNQRTTTNTALTNTVADQYRQVNLDITSSIGEINSVAVSPGDLIQVRLYRDTDTDTAQVRVRPNSTGVRFS